MTSSDAAAPAPAADLGRRAATASPPQAPPPANPSDDTSRSQSVGPALTTAVASTVEESANSNQPAFAANHTLEPTEKVSDHQWPTAADPIIHDSTVPPEPTQLSAPVPEPASPTADVAMPSPPTVSPLSTPAATHVHIDENLADEDIDNLVGTTTDAPAMPALRDPSLFRNPVFNPASAIPLNMAASAVDMMELDDPFQPSYPKHDQIQAIATTDPPPNAADFSTGVLSGMQHSQGSIDPNAYVMNLAAQATMFAEAEPDVVDPTAVSLHSFTQEDDALTGSVRPTSASGSQRLESYAQIEFADSTFQMTTYAVIIGRDQQAMEQARIDERREAVWKRKCEENERNGLPPPTPLPDTKLRNKYSKSYVSEEGGMLGPECSDGEGASRPVKKRRPSSVAQSSGGEENGSGDHGQSNRQYVSHTPGAAAVDLGVTQPTSEHIPFIAIHSPGPDIASKTRGISRQHLKIQFNKERGIFEAIALHKNGFFCQDVLYGVDKPATLKSGSLLQIKDVEFRFIINGVQWGMTGAEDEEAGSSKRMSIGGKEMSLDFEHSDHENFNDTSEELSDAENVATPILDESEIGEEAPEPAAAPAAQPVALDEEQALEALRQELGAQTDLDLDLPPEFAMPEIPKRRGPGRPPKDGIMSKRERRLLKKQLQETSKKTLPQNPESEKIKRPVGRPRKNPMPEDGLDSEKRKYNKKRPEGEPGSDTEKRVKEKKDKKVRPKSPPLELRREDYTEEQLQKPSKNYGVLIDEALTNGPPDGLTLKQIYKRIQARYPWFYFMAETKGWESSVRHNLIGNEAFLKDEETSLWSRVPGIELDAGKKRKATSPDRHLGPSHLPAHLTHPSYYQNNPYSTPSSNTYSHPALQAYSTDSKLPQSIFNANGQTAQAHATPSQPIQQATYAAQAPAPAQLPPGYGASALAKPASISQQSTYSSPYARPPPAAKSPVKAETNLPAPRASTATPNVYHAVSTQQYQSKPPVTTAPEGQRFSQTVEDAIKIFCSKMLTTLSQSSPHAAQIIGNSVSRFRGLAVPHPVQGSENTVTTLVDALQNMVKDMQARGTQTTPGPPQPATPAANPSPAPTSSAPQTATPTATLETEIRRRVKNFRESMIKALTTKTDKAETIVDNAINRAQGLPHGAKIAGWEKADDLMVKSVTQIITEARSDFGAKNHTASPAPPAPSREASLSQPVQTTQPAPPPPAQTNIRAEPSASPAPPQTALPRASTTPHIPNYGTTSTPQVPPTQSSASPAMSTAPSSVARPAMSFQRPAPTAVPGLSASPMPRPALPQKSTMPMQTPPAPRPNVSTPAVPSAGVLDQITAQRRFMDNKPSSTTPSQTNIHSGQTSANHVSTAVPGNNLTTGRTGNSTVSVGSSAASVVAPTTTSAGVGTTANKQQTSAASNPTGQMMTPATNNAGSTAAIPNASNATVTSAGSVVREPVANSTNGAPNFNSNIVGSVMTQSMPTSALPKVAWNSTTTPVFDTPSSDMVQSSGSAITANAPANAASSVVGKATTGNANSADTIRPSTGASPTPTAAVLPTDMAGASTPAAAAALIPQVTGVAPNTNTTAASISAVATSAIPRVSERAPNTSATVVTPTTSSTALDTTAVANPSFLPDTTAGHSSSNVAKMNPTIVAPSPVSSSPTPAVTTNTPAAHHQENRQSASNEIVTSASGSVGTNEEQNKAKAAAPLHNISTPTPPSAGVVDQIAGQKRSLDEGPGSNSTDQPEPKRLEVSSN